MLAINLQVLATMPESRQLFGSFTTAFLSLKVNEAWRRTLTSLACNFLKNVCHFLLLPSDGASKWRPCFRQAFSAATTDVFSPTFGTKQRKSCLAAKCIATPKGVPGSRTVSIIPRTVRVQLLAKGNPERHCPKALASQLQAPEFQTILKLKSNCLSREALHR